MMAYYGPDYYKLIEQFVLKAVESGPRPVLSITASVAASESAVRRVVAGLVASGRMKDFGSASKFGFDGRATRAYGLPDAGAGAADDLDAVEAVQLRRASRSGSGVITPRPYATGFRWGNAAW